MAHYPYLSTARKCGTLREIIRWQTVVAHYPYLSTARKCDTLHKIIHRYTIVAHHLKLNHPKAMLVQWPRLKSVTSQFQVQRVTATPVLWATAVQGTGLSVGIIFLPCQFTENGSASYVQSTGQSIGMPLTCTE